MEIIDVVAWIFCYRRVTAVIVQLPSRLETVERRTVT